MYEQMSPYFFIALSYGLSLAILLGYLGFCILKLSALKAYLRSPLAHGELMISSGNLNRPPPST